jgi:hypothetical protein
MVLLHVGEPRKNKKRFPSSPQFFDEDGIKERVMG